MRSIQTSTTFPLAAVKPLDRLMRYRAFCLEQTARLVDTSTSTRTHSPVTGVRLEPIGDVQGLPYARCPDTGSVFFAPSPAWPRWRALLETVSAHRHSPEAFHTDLAQSRIDTVYAPKLDWMRDTLRIQELLRPRLLEITTKPSALTQLLEESGLFEQVTTVDEMTLAHEPARLSGPPCHAALLLESLDRVDEPDALLRHTWDRLSPGGLIFVTALVASGFDVATLGLNNLYVYPPDRTNCFTIAALERLLTRAGFTLLEVSTPGVLDVEVVRAHLARDPALSISRFERQLVEADPETREAFQAFLQDRRFSSFARYVGRKPR